MSRESLWTIPVCGKGVYGKETFANPWPKKTIVEQKMRTIVVSGKAKGHKYRGQS